MKCFTVITQAPLKKNTDQHQSLTQKTVHHIINYIKENKLKEGDTLPSGEELLKMTGVSRVILREAMSYLKGMNMINSAQGSFYKISDLSVGSILENILPLYLTTSIHLNELFELRKTLELGSIEIAVLNANESQIQNIEKTVHSMEQLVQSEEFSPSEYNKLESIFHQRIIEPANSHVYNLISKTIQEYFEHSVLQDQTTEELIKNAKISNQGHFMIAQAFRRNNPSLAYACLKDSLLQVTKNNRAN